MALTVNVNGEASVWITDTNSTDQLGISVDGVEISVKLLTEPVRVDTTGPASWDEQLFVEEATIRAQLIVFDTSVLDAIKARTGSTAGTMGAAGDLLIAGGHAFGLTIDSTPAGAGVNGNNPCYTFPTCYLVDAWTEKHGTRATVANCTFRALLSQQLSSSLGAVLYTHDCHDD